MKILLAPHDDDHALFASFTCIREKPLVVIVLDSYIQPNRGEIGCSAEERMKETEESCKILGVTQLRLGLRDDTVSLNDMIEKFKQLKMNGLEAVYSPMLERGNRHHDMVSQAAHFVFGGTIPIIEYPTYTKTNLYTEAGNTVVEPTPEEIELKNKSLECYVSQIRINKPHFDAVMGKNEHLLI